jgi:hypothetical protein
MAWSDAAREAAEEARKKSGALSPKEHANALSMKAEIATKRANETDKTKHHRAAAEAHGDAAAAQSKAGDNFAALGHRNSQERHLEKAKGF